MCCTSSSQQRKPVDACSGARRVSLHDHTLDGLYTGWIQEEMRPGGPFCVYRCAHNTLLSWLPSERDLQRKHS